MWTYNYTYPSELYHYGVKGMKWGVRRYQNKDGSLTSEGRKRYNEEQKTNEKENRFGLSEKQKKYIKNGAIAVGVALAAYGTYKIADSGV